MGERWERERERGRERGREKASEGEGERERWKKARERGGEKKRVRERGKEREHFQVTKVEPAGRATSNKGDDSARRVVGDWGSAVYSMNLDAVCQCSAPSTCTTGTAWCHRLFCERELQVLRKPWLWCNNNTSFSSVHFR